MLFLKTFNLKDNIYILTRTSHEHITSVQLLNHVRLFATPWTAASQASLSITNCRSLLKLMSTESVMPTNHLILCHPLLLLLLDPLHLQGQKLAQ